MSSPPFHGLAESVAAQIRDDVLSGRLADGQRIIEREIAETHGFSRGPVRDALKQLHNEGLVVISPRRGARVATLTRADAAQIIEVRSSLEPLAVKYLIDRRLPAAFAPLEACLQDLGEAAAKGDWSALVTLDMRFHELVFRQSDSGILERIWETLRVPLLQTFRVHRSFYESGQQVLDSHRQLLDEMLTLDAERAQAASRAHVVDLRDQLLPTLSEGGPDTTDSGTAP
jgi:DNA-binding GntR family transcriptional regulator